MKKNTVKKYAALSLACTLAMGLTTCGSSSTEGDDPATPPLKVKADLSGLKKVDTIAKLVPEDVKDDGLFTIGNNVFYAPAEFYAEDGETAQGFDIDLSSALATVMGLKANVQQAEFDKIFPAIGADYEAGIASITINEDRLAKFDMIQYFEDGNSWTVAQGNPNNFDPAQPCGKAIGVQTGTYQDEVLTAMNAEGGECENNKISLLENDSQSIVTTKLVGGQIDAMYSDTSVANYAVNELQPGKLEIEGDPEELSGRGITLAQDNPELTEAVQAALQYLIDNGYLESIFDAWGIHEGVATEATLNPAVEG